MDINADVKCIEKLKDYFFVVPDYQREYVWKVDDQVEQFLTDVDNEFEPHAEKQASYFIGSIIIVGNEGKYDVIDGQQRLTTIVLSICALRELLQGVALEAREKQYLRKIESWLSDFDLKSDQDQPRLELQYDESKGFLLQLIQGEPYHDEKTASIKKMQQAYERIKGHFEGYLRESLDDLMSYARYFLTGIDLVVIESENLSSALKIFETINQRGAGLNAMDLVKNLLFSEAKESEFSQIKDTWRRLSANLEMCGEEQSPLRFLRYFLAARYHDGVMREDNIYKWIISPAGKQALNYQAEPLPLAKALEKGAQRYARLVIATGLRDDGGDFPSVTNIGYINKYKSRQHLVMLLAPAAHCENSVIEHLAKQLESFLFFSNVLGVQAKYYERLFAQWAIELRGVQTQAEVDVVIGRTMLPYLKARLDVFKEKFAVLQHTDFQPQYRERFVLGKLENAARSQCALQAQSHSFIQALQIEHILPQTPKGGVLPEGVEDESIYRNIVRRLGNVTLLEGQINQAVSRFNGLGGNWFASKQQEYGKSDVLLSNLLDSEYDIGKETALNRYRRASGHRFSQWDMVAIERRQKLLLELALDIWKVGGERIDA